MQRFTKWQRNLPLVIGTVALWGLFSCSVQNKIVLEAEGRGSMALSLELPSYMLDSIDIMAASIPAGEELLEPEHIAKELKRTENVSNVRVESTTKGKYNIAFHFENFAEDISDNDFFAWSKDPSGNTRLSITINRQTYQALERRFPAVRDNALLQLYGPAGTQDMKRSDYLDMIEYSFGSEARRDLPKFEAVISVQVPGKVISQTGGRKQSANTVEFRLRLLDFALLKQEKRYNVVYR